MELADTERLVLGSILLDEGLMQEVAHSLTPADFSVERNSKIFTAMLDLWRSNRPVDYVMLCGQFPGNVTTHAYMGDLTTGVPRRKTIPHLVTAVKAAANKRKLERILETSLYSEKSAAEISSELSASLAEFTQTSEIGREMFVDAVRFISTLPPQIDWMVEGLIERGANGIIAGVPKASKSWIAGALGLALALGEPWMGFRVPRSVRTALIAREDNPGLTGWRLRALFAGMGSTNPNKLPENLIVNTRAQSDSLMLDNPKDVAELIQQLKKHRTEFAIFDVFNVLHAKDENDNQEMRVVLQQLTRIQAECRCGIGLVHHFNKLEVGSWTQRLRGSSAISGWVEWLIGVTMADEESKIRRLEFEIKAAEPPNPLHYKIVSDNQQAVARMEIVPFEPPQKRSAARLMQ